MKRLLNELSFAVPVLVLATAGCGDSASDTKTDSVADTVAISAPVNIPGTHVMLSIPEGYTIGENFTGIQKDASTGIGIMELDGGNYYTNAATFTVAGFQAQGVNVLEFEEFKLDGYPAKLALIQGDAASKGYQLVFGDSTFSVAIMSFFPADNKTDKEEIKRTLAAVTYDKSIKVDYMASAAFTLNDTLTKYRFAKSSGGLYIFSIDGKKDAGEDESMFIVSQLPTDPSTTPAMYAQKMVTGLERNGMVNFKQVSSLPGFGDGYQTFEQELSCTHNGKKEMAYQLIIQNESSTLVAQGVSKSNFDKDMADFRKLANSIRFKDK